MIRKWRVLLWLPSLLLADTSQFLLGSGTEDLSLRILDHIFPIWGLENTALIGQLMVVLNMGISAFVCFNISYSVLYTTVGTAADGTNLGHKFRLWHVVRTVLGIFLLLPTQRGFSMLQCFILWCIFQGVWLANVVWEDVVDAMTVPTLSYAPQSSYWTDMDYVVGLGTEGSPNTMVTAIANAVTCNQYYYYYYMRKNDIASASSYIMRYNYQDTTDTTYNSSACGNGFTQGICFGSASNPTQCGSFALASTTSTNNWNDTNYTTGIFALQSVAQAVQATVFRAFGPLYRDAVEALYTNPNPTVTSPIIVSLPACDATTSSPYNCSLATDLVAAASGYLQNIATLRYTQTNTDTNDAIIDGFTHYGWATGGYFYTQNLGGSLQSTAQTVLPIASLAFNAAVSLPDSDELGPEAYAYAYLYGQLNGIPPAAGVRSNINQLLINMQQSADLISHTESDAFSCDTNPNNLVCSPLVNQSVALMLTNIFNNIGDLYSSLRNPTLDGMSQALLAVGSGGKQSTQNVSMVNMVNVSLCSLQAFTGVKIFQGDCTYNAKPQFNASPTRNCATTECVTYQASFSPTKNCATIPECVTFKNTCFQKAIQNGCITEGSGMFGSFYYNQTHAAGLNPLIVVMHVGQTLMQAGISSLSENAKMTLQVLIDAAYGYTALTTTYETASTLASGIMSSFDQSQMAFIAGYALSAPNQFFKMAYSLLLFNIRFMFDLFMAVNMIIIGFGAIYAVYLPAVPMIIYTLGVIGWIAIVIEAMVAAPLIAAGITYPEGGVFLGVAEQGFHLGLNVLLRPSMMVIALYMSTLVAQIGMTLLHLGMMTFTSYILGNMNNVGGLTVIVILSMLALIYVYIAFELLSTAYAFIAIMPDRVMKWFAEGTSESGGEAALHAVTGLKGQVQGMGQHVGNLAPRAPSNVPPLRFSNLIQVGKNLARNLRGESAARSTAGKAPNKNSDESTTNTIPVSNPTLDTPNTGDAPNIVVGSTTDISLGDVSSTTDVIQSTMHDSSLDEPHDQGIQEKHVPTEASHDPLVETMISPAPIVVYEQPSEPIEDPRASIATSVNTQPPIEESSAPPYDENTDD